MLNQRATGTCRTFQSFPSKVHGDSLPAVPVWARSHVIVEEVGGEASPCFTAGIGGR